MAEGLVWMAAAPILLILGAVGAVPNPIAVAIGPSPTSVDVPRYGLPGNTATGIYWESLDLACGSNDNGILYKVVAPSNGQMQASICHSLNFEAKIQVYHGDTPDTSTCVAGALDHFDIIYPNPQNATCEIATSQEFAAIQGESYLFLVNDVGGDTGTYTFSVKLLPQPYKHTKLPEVINMAAFRRQKLSIPSGGVLVLSLGLVALFGFATLTAVVVRRRIDPSRSEAIPLQL